MASINPRINSLMIGGKYCDLKLHCEGNDFDVHRAIVCTQSAVLAAECGDGLNKAEGCIIEISGCDALTLERMLQFLYNGDYAVQQQLALPSIESQTDDIAGSQQHVAGNMLTEDCLDQPRITHVLVYAMAERYELPDLKDLAFQKFGDIDLVLDTECFDEVVRAVYVNTTGHKHPLRMQTLQMALDALDQLMGCTTFLNALVQDGELQEFAGMLMPFAVQETHRQGSGTVQALHDRAEEQREVIERLLCELEGTKKNVQAVERLGSELKKANEDGETSTLKAQAYQARCQKRTDELAAKQRELEAANRNARDTDTKMRELTTELDEAKRAANSSKAEADVLRIDSGVQQNEMQRLVTDVGMLTERLANIPAPVQPPAPPPRTVQSQSHRSAEARLEELKKNLAAVSRQLAQEKREHSKRYDAQREVNNLVYRNKNCRTCYNPFETQLDWDDRSEAGHGMMMLRCKSCWTKHYGKAPE